MFISFALVYTDNTIRAANPTAESQAWDAAHKRLITRLAANNHAQHTRHITTKKNQCQLPAIAELARSERIPKDRHAPVSPTKVQRYILKPKTGAYCGVVLTPIRPRKPQAPAQLPSINESGEE